MVLSSRTQRARASQRTGELYLHSQASEECGWRRFQKHTGSVCQRLTESATAFPSAPRSATHRREPCPILHVITRSTISNFALLTWSERSGSMERSSDGSSKTGDRIILTAVLTIQASRLALPQANLAIQLASWHRWLCCIRLIYRRLRLQLWKLAA